ncbi:MAG: hypothetical protein LLG14_20385 [Nocardiaceae bacterium]|nr:hypothetical protein [Nocardiaceae bacterium]
MKLIPVSIAQRRIGLGKGRRYYRLIKDGTLVRVHDPATQTWYITADSLDAYMAANDIPQQSRIPAPTSSFVKPFVITCRRCHGRVFIHRLDRPTAIEEAKGLGWRPGGCDVCERKSA